MEKTIVIASRHLPNYYGGLGQYQRSLADYLCREQSATGMFVSESLRPGSNLPEVSNAAWKSVRFSQDAKWNRIQALCMRCASRPALHKVLEFLVYSHWTPRLRTVLPKQIDAVHFVGTGWDFFGFAVHRAARQSGARFTILPAVHPNQWGDDRLDIRLYNYADRVFTLSEHEKSWLVNKGVPADRISCTVLPPMCESTGNRERFRSQHSLSERPVVLFLGRQDEGKGYPALLQAWKLVRTRFPEACLVTVGPPLPSSQPALCREENGVLNLGMVSEQEKADALAACDIFCLPSTHESFGIVYIEAWSYSKPVICGTAPACRELIADNLTGLWSSQEPAQLSQDLCRLLGDPLTSATMGANGKREQIEKYTWEKVGQTHFDAFCKGTSQ